LRLSTLLISGSVYILVAAISASTAATNTPSVVSAPNARASSDTHPEPTIDTLLAEVAELRRKVEKPPKDAWDKLTAVSGMVSGLAVALIGFYATNVYNRRQRLSEERRKDQELLISQIQTVEKFIPYLSSKEESARSGALIAISALGNEELAVKLATAFGGTAATIALASIASTAGPQGVASAGRALQDIFEYFQARIVEVQAQADEGLRLGSGLIVAESGWIVTPSYVVSRAQANHAGVSVHLHDGKRICVKVLLEDEHNGLAILATAANEPLSSIDIAPSEAGIGDRIIALLHEENGHRIEIGTIVGTGVGKAQGKIVVSVNNVTVGGGGSSGSPVVDSDGKLVGLIYAIDIGHPGTVYLAPASDIALLVRQAIADMAMYST
jgi:S1-C subfamily serine protease